MQAVLARYRELGSTLEASRQVRDEFERGQHWHRLYERCWCGYLTVPTRYYKYDAKGNQVNTQEQAEVAFLEEINGEESPRPAKTPTESSGDAEGSPGAQQEGEAPQKTCNTCNKPVTGWGKTCNACRQAAYRERQATGTE